MITKKQILDSPFVEWLEGIAKSNFIFKTIVGIVIWVVALIPIWLYVFTRWLIGPEGFWQELVILCIAGAVIGWLQVIMAILGVVITVAILLED